MRREVIVISGLFFLGLIVYLFKQFSTPLLYGIDGPYYYVQIKSLLVDGRLKYVDPPLAFYLLTPFSILLGDITWGIKVGSTIIVMLTIYPLYHVSRDLGGGWEYGLISSAIYVFSPFLVRMSFDLIKNAIGLFFIALLMMFYVKALRTSKKRDLILAVLSLVAVGLTHILDFGVSLLILGIMAIVHLRYRDRLRIDVLLLLSGCVLLALGFISYSVMGGDPYKAYWFLSELLGFEYEATFRPDIWRVVPGLAVGIAGLASIKKLKGLIADVTFSLSLTLFVLNLPFIPMNYLWRFSLMSAILIPLVTPLILSLIRDNMALFVVSLMILGMILPEYGGLMLQVHPSITLDEYKELKAIINHLPPNASIITPDIRLKYWAETLYDNVYKSPRNAAKNVPVIMVIDKSRQKPWIPPNANPFYIGRYLAAYIISPRKT